MCNYCGVGLLLLWMLQNGKYWGIVCFNKSVKTTKWRFLWVWTLPLKTTTTTSLNHECIFSFTVNGLWLSFPIEINMPLNCDLQMSFGINQSINFCVYLCLSIYVCQSMCLCIDLSIHHLSVYHLFVYRSVYPSSVCWSVYLCICVYLSLPICLFVYRSICVYPSSTFLSVYLFINLSLSICLSMHLSVFIDLHLSISVFVHRSICQSIYLSSCLFICYLFAIEDKYERQRIRCTIVANIIIHHLLYSPNVFLTLLIDINDDHRAGWTFWWCNNELIVGLIQDFVDRLAVDFWDVLIRDQCTVRTYILFMKYFLQHQWHAMQHFNRYFSGVVSNVFIETTSHISMAQNHSTIMKTHTHSLA